MSRFVVIATAGVLLTFLAAGAIAFNGTRNLSGWSPDGTPGKRGFCHRSLVRESQVARQACVEIPELASPSVTAFEAANLLRRWVAGWIAIASDGTMLKDEGYSQKDVATLLREMREGEMGVYCGGTAWALMKLYEAFGFESWTYIFGEPGGSELTHAITLLRIGDTIAVQDAYFNLTFVTLLGAPMDVRALLDALRQKSFPAAATLQTDFVTRRVLLRRSEPLSNVPLPNWLGGPKAPSVEDCARIGGQVWECKAVSVSAADAVLWDRWSDVTEFMARRGLSPDLPNLMLFPIGLTSDRDGWKDSASVDGSRTGRLLVQILEAAR